MQKSKARELKLELTTLGPSLLLTRLNLEVSVKIVVMLKYCASLEHAKFSQIYEATLRLTISDPLEC